MNGKKISLKGLKLAFDRMDDGDGMFGKAGNWKIALGGYDCGYEIYFKGEPVMRVNYELKEYEFYTDEIFDSTTIPTIKRMLEITPAFDNIGNG